MEKEEEMKLKCQQAPLREFKPDQGWAWVILVASFFSMVLNQLPVMTFGILYAPVFERFALSSTHIAWINGLFLVSWNVTVGLLAPFSEIFGWRKVAIFGSALNTSSILLSAYVPNSALLFLYISLMGGMGGSISLSITFFVISNYFKKRRGMAMAITTLGSCGALLVGPPLAFYLNTNFGSQWSFIIVGTLMFNGIPLSYLFHPTEWHTTAIECKDTYQKIAPEERVSLKNSDGSTTNNIQEIATTKTTKESSNLKEKTSLSLGHKVLQALKTNVTNLQYLKQRRVLHICFATPFILMGYMTFQIWIPFAMVNRGFTLETASLCLSVAAVGNATARVVVAIFSDYSWFHRMVFFKLAIFVMSISILCFGFSASLILVIVLVSVWGFSSGVVMTLFTIAIIDVMGVDKFPVVFGLASLISAVVLVTVNPVIGFVNDQSTSFAAPLSIIAALGLVAFLLWATVPCAEAYDLKQEKKRRSAPV